MLDIPLTSIKKIEEIVQSDDKYISLSQGILRVGGIPRLIKEHMQSLLTSDQTDYYASPFGILLLRDTLAETLSKKFSTSISGDQVLISHGCIGGLSMLYLTVLEPGDEVILPEPTYPAYATLGQIARCKNVFVSMTSSKNEDSVAWEMDVEKIKAATTAKTKMIIFPNPWNPLGIIISKEKLLDLISWCESKQIFLVVDETFRDYVFEETFTSVLSFALSSDWVICAHSFSKNFGMSGWRIGYLILPPRLQVLLGNMQGGLLNCLNTPSQYAALFALKNMGLTENFYQIVRACRDLAIKELQPLVKKKIIDFHTPSNGFFIFFKTIPDCPPNLCERILYEGKVGLIPGATFGPSGQSFMRLCYAREECILKEGIHRLCAFLTNI